MRRACLVSHVHTLQVPACSKSVSPQAQETRLSKPSKLARAAAAPASCPQSSSRRRSTPSMREKSSLRPRPCRCRHASTSSCGGREGASGGPVTRQCQLQHSSAPSDLQAVLGSRHPATPSKPASRHGTQAGGAGAPPCTHPLLHRKVSLVGAPPQRDVHRQTAHLRRQAGRQRGAEGQHHGGTGACSSWQHERSPCPSGTHQVCRQATAGRRSPLCGSLSAACPPPAAPAPAPPSAWRSAGRSRCVGCP